MDTTDKPHDHCGIAGSYTLPPVNATNIVIEMGKALQHRGQNGGGIAVKARGKLIKVYKKAKAFNEIFSSIDVVENNGLRGEVAISHLRYPTAGSSREDCDAQPFYAEYQGWELALGHNGNIVDLKNYLGKLQKLKIETESDSDSEVLAWLIVTAPGTNWQQKISNALTDVKGAYSLVMVTGDGKLMALRDPWGIRPLVWTQDNNHVFVASETCALDRIDITHSQQIKPGELLIADDNGVFLYPYAKAQKQSFCVFEKLYFSHETSNWDGVIGDNRENLGKELAREELERAKHSKKEREILKSIDYVVAVPDTASPGAHAFCETLTSLFNGKLKLAYKRGIIKERYDYAKRTFIEDDPYLRRKHIEKKFFISPSIIGKSIYLIDDTAVRLNTFMILVSHLLRRGVKEIHCRFLAPPFINPCFLGVNIGSRDELGAVKKDDKGFYQKMKESEIKKKLDVTSIRYLTLPGMSKALSSTTKTMHANFCTGCLDYSNPFDMRPYDKESPKTAYIRSKLKGGIRNIAESNIISVP